MLKIKIIYTDLNLNLIGILVPAKILFKVALVSLISC